MALVVSGQARHRHMQPAQVHAALQRHLPGLVVSALDFSIERANCRIDFFCNTSSTLDFTVTVTAGAVPAPAAVALLVRETDSVTDVLTKALSRRLGKAELQYCVLEDERSRSGLLTWVRQEPPLASRPAKLSYLICLPLLILAAILVRGQLEQPRSDARDYNVLSLILAIGLPALTLPLPFLFEQLKTRGGGALALLPKGRRFSMIAGAPFSESFITGELSREIQALGWTAMPGIAPSGWEPDLVATNGRGTCCVLTSSSDANRCTPGSSAPWRARRETWR
jgi:hypothetical protein